MSFDEQPDGDPHGECALEIKRLEEEVQQLQRALSFWMPGVPMYADQDLIARAGADAWLLVGYAGENEPGAEELGWIVIPSQSAKEVAK